MDFSKAFDSIDHELFFKKFTHIGVRSASHKLIATYLADRFQCVRLHDKSSAMKSIKRGFPQLSILGPLFFFIYITDLVQTKTGRVKS